MPEPSQPTRSGALVATTLVTATGPLPVRGAEMERARVLERGAVAWEDGTIVYVGPADGLPADPDPVVFEGCTIAPGFVDCHTHLPFVGWRADEFEARLAGRSYRELHGEGGIYRSSRLLAEAGDEEVLAFCRPLVQEMADHGTTALELKTGYGLSVEAELRQARLARRLAREAPQTCTVTLLACHAVPKDTDRAVWVHTVCRELIPAAAAEGLVDAVDVYVEDIAFDLDDLAAVAGAAAEAGLALRCHADQLGASGAAEAAVALGARSADHLNHVSEDGVRALGSGTTVATVLPSSTLFIRGTPPPTRAMLEAGAALALATDFNPGTSPVLSMPEAIGVGCSWYGLSPHEALTAATANPAWVLGLDGVLGTLEVGKRADLLVLEGDAFRQVPYRPGHNPVLHTYVGGRRVGGR
ncbi:MAG: imidazolonepropionase [Candidatus Velamenicoccus archaeovorus]